MKVGTVSNENESAKQEIVNLKAEINGLREELASVEKDRGVSYM